MIKKILVCILGLNLFFMSVAIANSELSVQTEDDSIVASEKVGEVFTNGNLGPIVFLDEPVSYGPHSDTPATEDEHTGDKHKSDADQEKQKETFFKKVDWGAGFTGIVSGTANNFDN